MRVSTYPATGVARPPAANFVNRLKENIRQMHPLERRILRLRALSIGILLICFLCLFPWKKVLAQQNAAVLPVITVEDAKQDERIDSLREFRTNQENYNRQVGETIQRNADRQNARMEALEESLSWMKGIGSTLAALVGLINIYSVSLQIKRRQG